VATRAKTERVPFPTVEIIDLHGVGATLLPREAGLRRLFRRKGGRSPGAPRQDRYVLDARVLPAEILAKRGTIPLLALDVTGRPVLEVVPGMRGELSVGVSRMTVSQMLADSALRDPNTGATRVPLPNGARVRVHCGAHTFHMRVGGAPLPRPVSPPATSPAAVAPEADGPGLPLGLPGRAVRAPT